MQVQVLGGGLQINGMVPRDGAGGKRRGVGCYLIFRSWEVRNRRR